MRVTNGMIINTSLNGLYKNMNEMNKTYAQMSTGKKIQTVSDDPIIAGRALKLKTTVLEANQYESNLKEAMSWMEVTESSLDNMSEILKAIRTKCVQASTGTLEKQDLAAIKTDIEQLWKQLQEEANTTYSGRYVFTGYKTDEPLMIDGEVNPKVYQQIDNQKIEYEIGTNTTISVNTPEMDHLFQEMKEEFEEIFNTVDDASETSTQINELFTNKLSKLDEVIKEISMKTSDLGSRMSRIEYTQERLTDQKTTFKNLLSQTEDVDMEEVYTNFNVQYATYQSALQATSKIITNTLADYL